MDGAGRTGKSMNVHYCASIMVLKASIHMIDRIFDKEGYTTFLALTKSELNTTRTFIYKQWFNIIEKASNGELSFIKESSFPITKYHLIKTNYNHSRAFRKTNRMLGKDFCMWFEGSAFFEQLTNHFGEFTISDEEKLGYSNYYWRLTRPKENSDVGPLHRDSWFWDIDIDYRFPYDKFHRIKVWIPIHITKGLNGLLIAPGSQKNKEIKWTTELRDGNKKPQITFIPDDLEIELVMSNDGTAVIFNDDLLHGGAPNKSSNSRVSMEFTMIIKD